jgi:Chaperone of endosialidase
MGGISWANTSFAGDKLTGFIGNVFETVDQTKLVFWNRNSTGLLGEKFFISGNGNATLTGTLTQNSDSRLKKKITPINNALQSLTKLSGYNYYWKNTGMDNSLQTGVLAQEVQKIFPNLVKSDTNGTLSVNYNGLIPVMIESIKEQQKQIDELKLLVQKLLKK